LFPDFPVIIVGGDWQCPCWLSWASVLIFATMSVNLQVIYLLYNLLTLLQKLVKHKGHEGTQRKISSFSTVVYFVSFVVKGLFAVDSSPGMRFLL